MLRTCENKRQCFKVYHHCSGFYNGVYKDYNWSFLVSLLVLVLALLWKSIRTVAAFMFSNNGQS